MCSFNTCGTGRNEQIDARMMHINALPLHTQASHRTASLQDVLSYAQPLLLRYSNTALTLMQRRKAAA